MSNEDVIKALNGVFVQQAAKMQQKTAGAPAAQPPVNNPAPQPNIPFVEGFTHYPVVTKGTVISLQAGTQLSSLPPTISYYEFPKQTKARGNEIVSGYRLVFVNTERAQYSAAISANKCAAVVRNMFGDEKFCTEHKLRGKDNKPDFHRVAKVLGEMMVQTALLASVEDPGKVVSSGGAVFVSAKSGQSGAAPSIINL